MLSPAIPQVNPINPIGSALAKKVHQVLFQPYKIPGYLFRKYEHHFQGVEGSHIIWPEPGRALLTKFGMYRPRRGQVLVLTHASLVSPGTERAYFNRMPNTKVDFPFQPGYAGAGTVIEAGPGVTRFRVGDRVAADLPHSSIIVMDEDRLSAIPHGVTFEQACFVKLGVIALQGIRKANIQFGERVAVVGQGLVGQLVTQLGALAGAFPITAVAASEARLPLARQNGAHLTLSLAHSSDMVDEIEADVTIEVSGHPEAIHTAVRSTRPGGRIVILGSTRGSTRALDFEQIRSKGLLIIGAHVDSLPNAHSLPGWWTIQKEADTFFEFMAQGRVEVDSLISDEIFPPEAERFYRRLAWGDKSIVGGLFRWDRLPAMERFDGHLRQALVTKTVGPYLKAELARFRHHSITHNGISSTLEANGRKSSGPVISSRSLRIGLIGCGEIAIQNAKAVHEAANATVAAVADVNETVAKDLAQRYDVPYSTSVEELLGRDDIDAVLISVPHFLHAPLAIQAARAGKHVIVEKPMATNLTEADEMLTAAQEAGVHLTTLYCQRYLPYVQRAKALIDQGALGRILGVTFLLYQDKPISYYTSGFSGRVATDWRLSKEKSGGGILIFNMVHYLDIFRYLSDLDVTRAYGDFGALETPLDTEDTISVTLRYSNQAIGSLTASSVVRGALYQPQMRIWGTEGQLVLTEPDQHVFYSLRQIEDFKPGEWHSLGELPLTGDRREFITRFAQAILEKDKPRSSGESGRAIQAVIEAIYRSGNLEHPVVVTGLGRATLAQSERNP